MTKNNHKSKNSKTSNQSINSQSNSRVPTSSSQPAPKHKFSRFSANSSNRSQKGPSRFRSQPGKGLSDIAKEAQMLSYLRRQTDKTELNEFTVDMLETELIHKTEPTATTESNDSITTTDSAVKLGHWLRTPTKKSKVQQQSQRLRPKPVTQKAKPNSNSQSNLSLTVTEAAHLQQEFEQEFDYELDNEDLFVLFEDVEELARRLEAGEYFSGWGWDANLQEERAWGDESWVQKIEALFLRLDQAFNDGARGVCVTGYGRLLNLLMIDEEAGIFSGPKKPLEMLTIDIDLCKARYFRALYDSTPESQRVAALTAAFCQFAGLGEELGIQSLMAVAPAPLADLEEFIVHWQEFWRSQPSRRDHISLLEWQALCQWHYREAFQLQLGEPGLAWLARERGSKRPESYLQWIQHLVMSKQWRKAERAAKEASEKIEDGTMRAYLAEVHAVIAAETEDAQTGLKALIRAFRSAPSPRRLCNVLLAYPASERKTVLRREIEQCVVDNSAFDDRTLAFLDFLGGRFEAALVRFSKAAKLGWSDDEHPGRLLLPAFLWLCRPDLSSQSISKRIWRNLGRTIQSQAAEQQLKSIFHATGLNETEYWLDLARPDSTELIATLVAPDELSTQRRRALEVSIQSLVSERVQTIVKSQFRKAYDRAATAAVAVAEMLVTRETPEYFLQQLKKLFPRHRAFHREIKRLSALTPITLIEN